MTAPVTVKVDMKPFNDSLHALGKGLNMSVNRLLPYHAASVWKTAMNRTKTLKTKTVDRAAKVRALNDIGLSSKQTRGDAASTSINLGLRGDYGRVFVRLKPPTGKPRFVKTHDPVFSKNLVSAKTGKPVNLRKDYEQAAVADVREFKAAYRERLKLAKNTTHFGKQSFLSALQDLNRLFGIDWMKVPPVGVPGLNKILKAADRNGKTHKNGYAAIRIKDPKKLTIEMENHFPSDKIEAAKKIQSAIQSRQSAINREMRIGLFKDMEKVLQRYPFMKIR